MHQVGPAEIAIAGQAHFKMTQFQTEETLWARPWIIISRRFHPGPTWATRFAEMAKRHGAVVNVKPTDFGKVFPVSGGLPLPKRAPQRQAYRLVELKRFSDYLKLPLNLQPKFFPHRRIWRRK